MGTNFDFAPFYRSSIGFDRVFDLLENATVTTAVWPQRPAPGHRGGVWRDHRSDHCPPVIALQEIVAGAAMVEEIHQFLSSQRRAATARLSKSPEFGDDVAAGVVILAPDAGSRVERNSAAQKEKERWHVE